MPEGGRRLASALERLLATKQDRPQVYPGLMGAYVAGVASIKVAGRPDFVWVRLRGVQSEPIMAFNDKVAEHFDLPVLVYREPENPHLWRVYGRDVSKYQSWGGASYLPPHGRTHSLSGDEGAGSDIVWVQKGQFLPMLPHPNNSGSMSIYIEPEAYLWGGEYRYFPGTGTQSFEPRKPTGAFTSRFVTVYLRGSDGTLQYLNGDEYPATFPPNDIWSFISVPDPDEGFPIAAVNLFSGTQRLGWREVYDLRFLPGPLVGTGSSLGLLDEGIPLGLVGELEFVGAGVTTSLSGSRAQVSIPGGAGATGSVVIYDEDTFLGLFDELRFKGAGVDAYNSGSYVAVSIPGGGGDGAGVDQIGVYGLDDGVPLGTGTELDAGYGLDLTLSGTRLHAAVEPPVTGSLVVADEGAVLGSVPVLNFRGDGVTAEISGSYADIHIPGGGGGGGAQIGVYGLDDGVPLGTGTELNAGYGLDLTLSGTRLHLQAAPPVSGSVVLSDEGSVLGSVTHVDVRGARATATVSGSYGTVTLSPDPQEVIGIMGWHDGVPVGTGSVLNAVGLALSRSGSVLLLSDEVVDGYTSEWYMRTGGGVEAIALFPGAMTVQGEGLSQSVAFNMTNAYGDFMDGLFQGMLPYTLPDTGGDRLTNVGWLKLYDKNDPDIQWFYRVNCRPERTVLGGEPTGSWTFVNVTRLVSKGEFSSGTLVAASFVPPTLAYQGLLGYEDGAIVGTGTKLDVGYGLDLSVSGQVYGGARFLLEVAPPVSGSVVIADEGTVLGSVPIVNFRGAGVTAEISGSYADIHIPGGGGDGGGGLGIFALDDGVPLGTGTSIDFGDNLTASLSGTRIRVDAQAGGGLLTLLEDGVTLGNVDELDLLGSGFDISLSGSRGRLKLPGKYDPDWPPITGSLYDDEFDDGVIGAKWTGTAVYDAAFDLDQTADTPHASESYYDGYLLIQAVGFRQDLTQIPATQPFTLVCKLSAGMDPNVNDSAASITVRGQATNIFYSVGFVRFTNMGIRTVYQNGGGAAEGANRFWPHGTGFAYIMVTHDGAKNFSCFASSDGLTWSPIEINRNLSALTSFAYVEISAGGLGAVDLMCAVDFYRFFAEENQFRIGRYT